MALLEILVAPDPRLKKKAAPVAKVDGGVRALMDDMLETMYDARGIGLAAPQVGVLKRVIVADVAREDEDANPITLANPEIIKRSPEMNVHDEGCLSLPEHYAEVERPEKVTVRYLDREGEIRVLDAGGLLATCIQHEIDHLEGTLFVDHISGLRRTMILKKLQKFKKQRAKEKAAV